MVIPRTDSTRSPCLIPAFAAGESATTCQATTPCGESIQVTPSSGRINLYLYQKFSTATITAASVRSARTTSPNRIRMLSFIKKHPYRSHQYASTSGSSESQIPIRVNLLNCVFYSDLWSPVQRQFRLWKASYCFQEALYS